MSKAILIILISLTTIHSLILKVENPKIIQIKFINDMNKTNTLETNHTVFNQELIEITSYNQDKECQIVYNINNNIKLIEVQSQSTKNKIKKQTYKVNENLTNKICLTNIKNIINDDIVKIKKANQKKHTLVDKNIIEVNQTNIMKINKNIINVKEEIIEDREFSLKEILEKIKKNNLSEQDKEKFTKIIFDKFNLKNIKLDKEAIKLDIHNNTVKEKGIIQLEKLYYKK